MSSGEFDLIARYFAPLAVRGAPAFGLGDDAAVYSPPPGKDLVFTKDALVADVHFQAVDPANLIARKAMRVNLSDLAAMGAEPVGYLLALTLPREMANYDDWVRDFAAGLRRDQDEFAWALFGGDTVSTSGPLTLSLTAIGAVARGQALRRAGARAGDDIYVSGTLGDAAFGLKCLQGEIPGEHAGLVERYHLPRPRLALGRALFGLCTAAMDISDGLAGDIRHICALSGLGAEMVEKLIPVSPAVGKLLESFPLYKRLLWNGGDDYELLFTAPGHEAEKIQALSAELHLPLTRIGRMTQDPAITIKDNQGRNLLSEDQGFRHF